jgi:uncharacterized protein YkwD
VPPTNTGAKVLSSTLSPSAPLVGKTVTLKITAQDAGFAVDGLSVDTGDKGKEIGASSCEEKKVSSQFTPGHVSTFVLTFTFTTPGVHTVTWTVLSGGCDSARTTQGSITVTVGAASSASTRVLAQAAAKKKKKAKAKACKNANVLIGPSNVDASGTAILCLLNQQRAKKHLKALKADTLLRSGALFQANDMVTRHFFAHVGPGGPGVVQRFKRVGYRSPTLGENIAFASAASPSTMVAAWMASPPHKANILFRGYHYVGVGIVLEKPTGAATPGDTFVTDFGSGKH